MHSNDSTHRRNWPTTKISLLERIHDHQDVLSWDHFVRIYSPLIVRYCCRRGLQETDARDVVQDVLLQVSKGIAEFRYDPQRGLFRSWLGTITHRAMLKHQARSRRVASAAGGTRPSASEQCQQPLGEVWVEAFNAHVYRTAVNRVRLHFDQETWQVFEATFVENHPPEQVATELQRTVGWVYQAKSKVVRRLKEEILYLAEDSAFFNIPSSGSAGSPHEPGGSVLR
jgi:RNA polymerase sigma factor (sigma-70 family)